MNKQRKTCEKGITLIALVITIVVLLILAGVTLSIVFNGGIINKSQQAVDTYSGESAKEKLEIELVNMLAEKVTNKSYNKEEFLTEKLINAGFSVNGDIVIVDGWQFEIDRNAPKIINSLGKGTKNEEIKIELSQEVSDDYTASTVTVKITYNGELKEININGEKINPIPEAVDGIYTITKEIKENKTIGILIKDAEDNYNIDNIKVSALTEDMEIKTAEDFKLFRDKVNEGRTFEGRIVTLAQDIDLNQGKYEISEDGNITFSDDAVSWIPIGNYSQNTNYYFAGTFEGNNHTISGIYVNNSTQYQGLFGNSAGTIQNLVIDKGVIKGTNYVGGIVGNNGNNKGKINNCVNKAKIDASGYFVGGIAGSNGNQITNCINIASINGVTQVGGIAGHNVKTISKCINSGVVKGNNTVGGINGLTWAGYIDNCINLNDITSTGCTKYSTGLTGGISGCYQGNILYNCYNIGNISGIYRCVGGIVGAADTNSNINIYNVYNAGTIKYNGALANSFGNASTTNVGYIVGTLSSGKVSQYFLNVSKDTLKGWSAENIQIYLGSEFIKDENDKYNGGYPVLKWQKNIM